MNSFVTAIHEAVILYAIALNETISEGYNITNGTIITHKMWNRTFEGIFLAENPEMHINVCIYAYIVRSYMNQPFLFSFVSIAHIMPYISTNANIITLLHYSSFCVSSFILYVEQLRKFVP